MQTEEPKNTTQNMSNANKDGIQETSVDNTKQNDFEQTPVTPPSEVVEASQKREAADDRTVRAATHDTEGAPSQAPPHFDATEAREKIR